MKKTLLRYEVFHLELPEDPQTANVIATPLRTIYVNVCAAADSTIDRLFTDIRDLRSYFQRCARLSDDAR